MGDDASSPQRAASREASDIVHCGAVPGTAVRQASDGVTHPAADDAGGGEPARQQSRTRADRRSSHPNRNPSSDREERATRGGGGVEGQQAGGVGRRDQLPDGAAAPDDVEGASQIVRQL